MMIDLYVFHLSQMQGSRPKPRNWTLRHVRLPYILHTAHIVLCLCGFGCVHTCMAVYITDSEEGSWYPKEKLKQAEKKLQGYNSAYIMR